MLLRRAVSVVACGAWLLAAGARANGRMPGANELAFRRGSPEQVVARATFGIVQSGDRGATWSWICEQAIDVSGVIADPPLAVTGDGSLVLLPPTGSALVSHDGGCNWLRVEAPLTAQRGADLTVDPSDAKRVLIVTSTLRSIDDTGFGSYENLIAQTRDDAQTFQLLATLPTDFEAETIEVARSDPQRIYVSGSDAHDPRLGIILRSEDGGQSFHKSTFALPAGTGSLWISGIHPTDPDRLWVRVAARGDTPGLLPARLYLSTDKGEHFAMLAATTKGMFGFALSPDGASLAYGGPNDGLYVGASDGSGGFTKHNELGVRCLRWLEGDALYACGSEPADDFSVGVSNDRGISFRPLYRLQDTCPASCADGTSFANSCQLAWTQTRPFIAASAATCSVPWSVPMSSGDDAGLQDAGDAGDADARRDAPIAAPDAAGGAPSAAETSPPAAEASAHVPHEAADDGCACGLAPARPHQHAAGLLTLLGALGWRRRERKRRAADRRSSP